LDTTRHSRVCARVGLNIVHTLLPLLACSPRVEVLLVGLVGRREFATHAGFLGEEIEIRTYIRVEITAYDVVVSVLVQVMG